MTILSSGVVPASLLIGKPRPSWLAQWGRFAHDLALPDLPAEVVSRSKLVLLDSIGVIASGMREKEMQALVPRLAALNGGANAGTAVIGSPLRLPAATAAFLNGTAGTMLELDEGNQYARGHPGIHVVPAALASAELLGASGQRLLVAIALGYEIGARIGIASKLRVAMHPHGTWGTVGAAIGTAKLNAADAQALVDVLLKQADHAISEDQACFDIGKVLEEIRQDRNEIVASEPDRSRHDQLAGRRGVFAAGDMLGFRDVGENALARGKIRSACIGEHQLAARSVEKLGGEVRFKF